MAMWVPRIWAAPAACNRAGHCLKVKLQQINWNVATGNSKNTWPGRFEMKKRLIVLLISSLLLTLLAGCAEKKTFVRPERPRRPSRLEAAMHQRRRVKRRRMRQRLRTRRRLRMRQLLQKRRRLRRLPRRRLPRRMRQRPPKIITMSRRMSWLPAPSCTFPSRGPPPSPPLTPRVSLLWMGD